MGRCPLHCADPTASRRVGGDQGEGGQRAHAWRRGHTAMLRLTGTHGGGGWHVSTSARQSSRRQHVRSFLCFTTLKSVKGALFRYNAGPESWPNPRGSSSTDYCVLINPLSN